jgi:multidrug efflux system membrane fusion protein
VKILLSALSIGFLVSLTSACGSGSGAPDAKAKRPALVVRTAPVAVQDVVYEIKSLGTLEAQDLVQVTAQVEGAVAEVRFHEGDRVTPETVLLSIDPQRYRLEAERAEASYRQVTADAERAQADLARRQELAASQLVAAEELTRAKQDTAGLRAASEAQRAASAIARQNLARSEVRAPMAGMINTRTVDTGQFVKTGDVLATIVDTSRLRLRFRVSEGESLYARVGGAVRFRVAALGTQTFEARIYHVGQVADPTTRQVEVLAWVRNPGVLKPGFFAEVLLTGETRKAATVIPEGAVLASEQGFISYVVVDGKAALRPVQVGLRTATGQVEVRGGLKPGEIVVAEGSDRLSDGVPVQEAPAPGGETAAAAAAAK